MFKTSLQRNIRNSLAFFTIGIGWITLTGMPAKANPVVIIQNQPPTCSSVVLGSPIPAPVPLNTVTGEPCSFSSSLGYTTPVRTVIYNPGFINPTIINPRISNSVLVNPVIINAPRYPYGTFGGSTIIYRDPGNIRIRISK
jgi:hypothetical protein